MSGGADGRLRVTHVLGGRGGVGGAERVLAALVSEGGRFEHRVVAPFVHEQDSGELRRVLRGVPVVAGGAGRLTELASTRRWLAAELDRRHPDVVHAHLFHASALLASLAPSVPRVLTHHHGSLFRDQQRRALMIADRWAGRRYERVVAVSEAVADFLVDVYRYPRETIEIIHNGWAGSPEPRSATGPDFIAISHLRREKGHDVLLEAFALVRDEAPGVSLRLVGDGPLRPDLERRAADLGVADSVEFVGAVDDVWSHLAEARIAVLPSRTEPQGIAALEALAAGCPLVASRVGGIPEMIEHGRNGHLVSPGDPRSLASAMFRLHTDAELRERYRAEGRQTAELWRMETTVRRYEALYREVAGPSGGESRPS